MTVKPICLSALFSSMDGIHAEEEALRTQRQMGTVLTAIDRHMGGYTVVEGLNGIKRIQLCRQGLDALDRRGWNRSFHQRLFHEEYLKSCARIFFKRDGPGAFAKYHNRLLELNSWDSTPQEILVSTPRRFGKTISVSMFAAAMVFACPNLELSIYSTCKRISQKLLRNIVKFLDLIFLEMGVPPYKILRMNSEEVHVEGNEGHGDVRVVNSYPSKIGTLFYAHCCNITHTIPCLQFLYTPSSTNTHVDRIKKLHGSTVSKHRRSMGHRNRGIRVAPLGVGLRLQCSTAGALLRHEQDASLGHFMLLARGRLSQ